MAGNKTIIEAEVTREDVTTSKGSSVPRKKRRTTKRPSRSSGQIPNGAKETAPKVDPAITEEKRNVMLNNLERFIPGIVDKLHDKTLEEILSHSEVAQFAYHYGFRRGVDRMKMLNKRGTESAQNA